MTGTDGMVLLLLATGFAVLFGVIHAAIESAIHRRRAAVVPHEQSVHVRLIDANEVSR